MKRLGKHGLASPPRRLPARGLGFRPVVMLVAPAEQGDQKPSVNEYVFGHNRWSSNTAFFGGLHPPASHRHSQSGRQWPLRTPPLVYVRWPLAPSAPVPRRISRSSARATRPRYLPPALL